MISVALIEPISPGNVGAVARVMKNFDLKELIIVNPQCDPLSEEAFKRARHAEDVLKKMKVVKSFSYLKKFDYVIGTTANVGSTDYNIPRLPVRPEDLRILNKSSVILFGREDSGLTNEEILNCDFIVSIPASKKYKTLNVSHSAAIIFYEIFKNNQSCSHEHIRMACGKDKDLLLKIIYKSLGRLKFSTPDKKETQRRLWKRVVGKSYLTKREFQAMCGFFKKIK
ncbi:RNA methyltransferase [Candidatus Woesearchaeota archaeon]|nr:RNA methyltransferase [Candidatus Woesearchaeota archaeon]